MKPTYVRPHDTVVRLGREEKGMWHLGACRPSLCLSSVLLSKEETVGLRSYLFELHVFERIIRWHNK